MAQLPDTAYSALADADLKFADAVDSQGSRHPLSQGTFVLLEESTDRVLRKSAYENLYDGFTGVRNTAAAVLNGQNQQLKFFSQARNYGSALEASLTEAMCRCPSTKTSLKLRSQEAAHPRVYRVRPRKKLLGGGQAPFL